MRKAMLAGNWKMFKSADEASAFAAEFKDLCGAVEDRDVLICPPYIYIDRIVQAFEGTNIKVGGQDLFWEEEGAYTACVSGSMLKGIGAEYVIVGHSERRQYFGETDETVNRRTKAALKNNLIPVVCVGETEAEFDAGKTLEVIETQTRGGLQGLEDASQILIAYEPVWAIGTGKTATPEIAQDVHAKIRAILADMFGEEVAGKIRILYGGSVKPDNVDDLMAKEDIDGALVGGASLDPKSFERIVKYKG